jgi:acetolactate synthase-1/2/3 large subunit
MKIAAFRVIRVSTKTAEVDPVCSADRVHRRYCPMHDLADEGDITPNRGWDFDHMLAIAKAELDHTGRWQTTRGSQFSRHRVQQVRIACHLDGIICLDNGVYKIMVLRAGSPYLPNAVLLDNALLYNGRRASVNNDERDAVSTRS